jgi:23S rRNA pseudouridine2604 synthase
MAKRTKKLTSQGDENDEIRINKFLSESGVCSRREADRYITEGKVKIDGIVAEMGSKVTKDSVVTFMDKPVKREEKLVLIAFNKPEGIVCTTDQKESDNIIDFIKYGMRIYPIGRLDKDSEGLILLTNDGNIVNKILRAEHQHEKEYVVRVNKELTAEFIQGMSTGVPILDTVTNPCKVTQLDKYTFNIILTQGLNRQIRRMCEYFDYRVVELTRVRIMNIQLGRLKTGDYRNVTEKEIEELSQTFQQQKDQKIDQIKHETRVPEKSKTDKNRHDKSKSDKTKFNKGKYDKNKYEKTEHVKIKHEKDKSEKTGYKKLNHGENRNEKTDYIKLNHGENRNEKTDYKKLNHNENRNEKTGHKKTDHKMTEYKKLKHEEGKREKTEYKKLKHEGGNREKSEYKKLNHEEGKHEKTEHERISHEKDKHGKAYHGKNRYDNSKNGSNHSSKYEKNSLDKKVQVRNESDSEQSKRVFVSPTGKSTRSSHSMKMNPSKENDDRGKIEYKGKKTEKVQFSNNGKRRSSKGYSDQGKRNSSNQRSKFR